VLVDNFVHECDWRFGKNAYRWCDDLEIGRPEFFLDMVKMRVSVFMCGLIYNVY